MHYGLVLPFAGEFHGHTIVDLAHEAEEAGWDGVFVWDGLLGDDPWVVLGAVALRTERVRIGPMVTPISRRRPWKLASETATLDHLSNGRLILSVGLGALDTGFANVGEKTDRKIRAQMLDEGLEILTGLWSGEPFSYDGEHYQVQDVTLHAPLPVQSPRIPIWVVAAWPRPASMWPRKKSMRRALRYDGVLPQGKDSDGTSFKMTPLDVQVMKEYVDEQRTQTTPFDIVFEVETPDDREQAVAMVRPLAEAGVTWLVEDVYHRLVREGDKVRWERRGLEGTRVHIKQGPPRID